MRKYDREYSDIELVFDEPIWMLISIWNTSVAATASKYATMKEFLNTVPQIFWLQITDSHANLMAGSWNVEDRFWRDVACERISNYDAFQIFGIRRMEEAVERTVSSIPKDSYTKKLRKLKLKKLNSL